MKRIIVAILVLFCSAAPAAPDDEARLQKRVDVLRRQMERMVGVTLKAPVLARYATRDAYERLLAEPDDRKPRRAAESPGAIAYRLLGLLPEKTDLARTTVTMKRMQTGAFYDPGTQGISVLEGRIAPSALDALLFHELVHAAQDQEHDLRTLRTQIRKERNHDRRLALQFLVEGEASFWTMVYQLRGMGQNFLKLPATARGFAFSPTKALTSEGIIKRLTAGTGADPLAGTDFSTAAESLKHSPPILIRKQYDPYLRGMYAVYKIWDKDGRQGIRRAFRQGIPRCTRDVMFADAWFRAPRAVAAVTPAPMQATVGADWTNIFEDTAGAITLHTLFEHDRVTADRIAKGWDGDRQQVWKNDRDRFIAGVVAFDSTRTASTFAKALEELYRTRWHERGSVKRDRCKTLHLHAGGDHLLIAKRKTIVFFLRGDLPSNRHDILAQLEKSEVVDPPK